METSCTRRLSSSWLARRFARSCFSEGLRLPSTFILVAKTNGRWSGYLRGTVQAKSEISIANAIRWARVRKETVLCRRREGNNVNKPKSILTFCYGDSEIASQIYPKFKP